MNDEFFMRRALELARKGEGRVNPNPPVGAVVVKDGQILGEGWHERYGGPHAERIAIEKARGKDLRGATLYVTLEPCDHYGKTPPCTDLIIESGITRVVVALEDPNPLSGNGIKKLRDHGIAVEVGVLREEAAKLCEVFITYVKYRRPFVALKFASTIDGKISDFRGNSKWITDHYRLKSHELRNKYMAIMVGANTVMTDDPLLTCRLDGGRSPRRVILDGKGKLAGGNWRVFLNDVDVYVFTASDAVYPDNVTVFRGEWNVDEILIRLYEEGIDSVLVEGGASVLSQFLSVADVVHAFFSTRVLGKGLSAFENVAYSLDNAPRFKVERIEHVENEVYMELRPCSRE